MNILIASDKFKDACTAKQVGIWLKEGIRASFPEVNIEILPLADGGEGTLDALAETLNATWQNVKTKDPLFREIAAAYIRTSSTAIIEMSRASGFELLKPKERNPMQTTSLGTGLQLVDAINNGAKEIVLTVGGTATNDAGMGIAHALGVRFLDKEKKVLTPIGKNLIHVNYIDTSRSFINGQNFKIATDVENPFCGPKGAAHVFGEQKGANKKEVDLLDAGLRNLESVLVKQGFVSPQKIKGAGAGGGVAGGLFSLFNAEVFSAANWILEVNQLEKKLQNTDILITGEGKLDSQTWGGKLISRLVNLAHLANTKSILVCGTLQDVEQLPDNQSIIHVSSIIHEPISLKVALASTENLLKNHGVLLGKFLKKMQ